MIIDYDFKNLVDFKIKVGTVSSFKLCEIIVSNRYLGILKDEAIICMVELVRRRLLDDDFNFEETINKLTLSLPKFKLDMTKIIGTMGTIGSMGIPGIIK